MLPKLLAHLEGLAARLSGMESRLAAEGNLPPSQRKEMGALRKNLESFLAWKSVEDQIREARLLAAENASDESLVRYALDEAGKLESSRGDLEKRLEETILLADEDAGRNVILEIRAGTGGEEAALFAADLFRMYRRWTERKGYRLEILDSSTTELGGLKEVVAGISGEGIFKQLRYESGGHRVQRVPTTEQQGRIHTSAVTVAILPEAEEVDITINPADLRIDTFSAGGPGGQHVNKTQSAVRIVHIPTNTVVSCQDERSQHKNKARAMRVLRSRVYEQITSQKKRERDSARKTLIGTGERSDRIRTYNFPQSRVTDHRIDRNFNLLTIIEGDLDDLVSTLQAHDRELRIKEFE